MLWNIITVSNNILFTLHQGWRTPNTGAKFWYQLHLPAAPYLTDFDVHVTMHIMLTFVWQNQPDALISQIYSWNETLRVSDSSSVHHQEFFTVNTAMVYVIQVMSHSLQTGSGWNAVPSWSCLQAVCKIVWHIPLLCVQWKTPDDGQKNCPKHVGFHSKNKFEKLVHLVGFIIQKFTDFLCVTIL